MRKSISKPKWCLTPIWIYDIWNHCPWHHDRHGWFSNPKYHRHFVNLLHPCTWLLRLLAPHSRIKHLLCRVPWNQTRAFDQIHLRPPSPGIHIFSDSSAAIKAVLST
jgi:hypothetical protein